MMETGPHGIRNLGDGLILRRATVDDTEALVEFNARVHSDRGWETPDAPLGAWVRDLMTRPHPTVDVGDFLVVEETATGRIVSSSNLISQTWSYAGVEFGVGRPEVVGTHPDYRRRGLVRAQFEVLHRWGVERGHKVQVITGIPWYYRQFGYEMALELHGSRSGAVTSVPQLKGDEREPFRIRRAELDDLPFVARTAETAQERCLVRCVRDAALWRYELSGRSQENSEAKAFRMIETPAGEPVGFLVHPQRRWGNAIYLLRYELQPDVSWWSATPTVLRYLSSAGENLEPYWSGEDATPLQRIAFGLGSEHPAYEIAEAWLPKVQAPYAWHLRVADLPDVLRALRPVLERRLAQSSLVGHSATLKLDFYRDGVKVVLVNGRVREVTPWPLGNEDDNERRSGGAVVRFPNLTFLQVLFGYRSLAELQHAYADCGGNLEGRLLINALFPKHPSAVWPIS